MWYRQLKGARVWFFLTVQGIVCHARQVKAAGKWISCSHDIHCSWSKGVRNACCSSASLPHLCGLGTQAGNGTTYHPRWMDHPTPISETKIISQRHAQRAISQVILDSATWTININYYTRGGCEPPYPLPSILWMSELQVYTTTLGSSLISKGGNSS